LNSLKRNIVANYVGQIYVTLIGILLMPAYVKYMGAEAYGLVGFYAMLQAWFMLLDIGLTPTMIRETARYRGGSVDALSLRRFLRALEGIFIAVAFLGSTAIIAGSRLIAGSWLKVQQLPLQVVQHAVMLIAMIIALRWACGLYRGAINGFERLVWLSGFNIAIATLRFVLVIPVFIYVGTSPTTFFGYQLVIALVEVTVLVIQTYRLMPKPNMSKNLPWQWEPLRGVLRFSLAVAFTSSVWVFVTQTDKLILSKFLTLSEYAYFTLAVLLASGVMVISGPISGALLPRMVKLNAEGNEAALILLYRNATQMVAVIAIPTSLVLAFFAKQVLWAWTGNELLAHSAAPVLTLYALGNGILALGAFPYYLQFAKGDLKLHLIGNALFVVILIPAIIWATIHYGVTGAGYAWLCANSIYFLFWVPKVHRRFVKGLHKVWLLHDLAGIIFVTGVCSAVMQKMVVWPVGRASVAIVISSFGFTLVVIAGTASSWIRETINRRWHALLTG
jgi:O-antigen/teichoic acid export membrane protein